MIQHRDTKFTEISGTDIHANIWRHQICNVNVKSLHQFASL